MILLMKKKLSTLNLQENQQVKLLDIFTKLGCYEVKKYKPSPSRYNKSQSKRAYALGGAGSSIGVDSTTSLPGIVNI